MSFMMMCCYYIWLWWLCFQHFSDYNVWFRIDYNGYKNSKKNNDKRICLRKKSTFTISIVITTDYGIVITRQSQIIISIFLLFLLTSFKIICHKYPLHSHFILSEMESLICFHKTIYRIRWLSTKIFHKILSIFILFNRNWVNNSVSIKLYRCN